MFGKGTSCNQIDNGSFIEIKFSSEDKNRLDFILDNFCKEFNILCELPLMPVGSPQNIMTEDTGITIFI